MITRLCGLVLIGVGLFCLLWLLRQLHLLSLHSSGQSLHQQDSENVEEIQDHRILIYAGEALRNNNIDPISVLLSEDAYQNLKEKDLDLWNVLICIIKQDTE